MHSANEIVVRVFSCEPGFDLGAELGNATLVGDYVEFGEFIGGCVEASRAEIDLFVGAANCPGEIFFW